MKTILTPVDFSSATRGVIAAAQDLARATDGQIVLFHAVQQPVISTDYGLTAEMLQEAISVNQEAARSQLEHLEQLLVEQGVPVRTRLVGGFAAGNILEEARKLRADYIVLGSHGHTAFYDLLVGSTTNAVLKNAPCPVVVVPPERKKALAKKR